MSREMAPRPPRPRRSAGTAPVTRPANDDEPTTAALIGNLKRKPSATPFWFATFLSAFWLIACAAYLWNILSPELSKGTDLGQLLAGPEIVTIMVMTVLPVSLVFAITYMVWRAQQMRQISEALGQTAIRLIRPEEIRYVQ
jgi:hypothetical protein